MLCRINQPFDFYQYMDQGAREHVGYFCETNKKYVIGNLKNGRLVVRKTCKFQHNLLLSLIENV